MNSTSSGVIERLSRPAAALLPIVAALLFWHVIPRSARGNENTDYRLFYRPVAGALVAGEGWEVPPGFALAAYPPGYPLLLAAVLAPASRLHVGEQTALDVFALACLAGSSLLVFTLARRLAGPRVALCASAALSTYPPLLWLSKQPNSELPFLVFLIGSVLATADLALAHRRGVVWPLLAGALAGGAMLIRPIGLVLPPALAVSLAVHPAPRRQRVTRIALLLLGSAVAVLPWELWVATRTGVVVPLSSSGPASVVDGLTFGVRSKGYRQAVALPAPVERLMRDLSERLGGGATLSAVASALVRECRGRPFACADLIAVKAARSWYGTDSGRHEVVLMAVQLAYAALVVGTGWLGWRAGGGVRWLTVTTWLITALFWGMAVAVLSIARYTTPAAALLVGLAPLGMASGLRKVPRLPGRRAGPGSGEVSAPGGGAW